MELYVWFNGADWVIATSAADAADVMIKFTGASFAELEIDENPFELWPDDKLITIRYDDAPEGHEKRTQTPAEWIKDEGRTFLCSTEF